ncbi:serine threonine-protein phosphatase 6 regulatory ankyrin repeat subunit a [Fusarium avenaceum]|nr:serine threonine-protein phosphatase 6 regulatory ankyrin repeat subunit a [Fusarium avenaceum]
MLRPKYLRLLLAFLPFAGVAEAAEDEEDNTDFLLNVFSDVGPILALFGEQFARQFLSETFTWEDHVIFACVPLGIMTAIAGAIRVQGDYLLRAFIGRAREDYAAAEIEYLSSTSNEVCELFNGKGIIRTMGNPTVAQLIVLLNKFPKPDDESFDLSCGIHTLESATKENVMYGKEYSEHFNLDLWKWLRIFKRSPLPSSNASEAEEGRRRSNDEEESAPERDSEKGQRFELFLAVIASVILQIGLLIIAGTTSTLVSKLFWIQRTQRTSSGFKQQAEKAQENSSNGDSAADSSATQHEVNNKKKDIPWWLHHLPFVAVVAGGSGFTVQFIGLRGLPWPCAVSQLIALMIMALIRACERFDNSKKEPDISNPNYGDSQALERPLGQKLSQFREKYLHSKGQHPAEDEVPEKTLVWKVETAEKQKSGEYIFPYPRPKESSNTRNIEAQRVVLVRKRLGDLCKWTSSASRPALALARSIERFLDEFLPDGLPSSKEAAAVNAESVAGHPPQNATPGYGKTLLPDISECPDEYERIEWKIPLSRSDTGPKTEVKLLLTRKPAQKGGTRRWMADLAGIEAVLSLWMAYLEARNSVQDSKTADWRRAGVASNVDYRRILGKKGDGVLKRDISWWVNNPEIYTEEETQEEEHPDTENSTAKDPAAEDDRSNEVKITIGFIGSSTGSGPTELKPSQLLLQYSNADLATLSAQHLFTSFMWTIGKYIPRQAFHQGTFNIGENVKVQSSRMFDLHSNVGKLSGRKLSNVNLTRFVTYAEKQGLGTADEILLCIIPTFSLHDRLPNDVVLGCDQPELKLPGSLRSKDQACAKYSYFLDWIHSKKGGSLEEYISRAAVARTVEYIYLLALDLTNNEASAAPESKPDSRSDVGESTSDAGWERSGSSPISSDSPPGTGGDSEADNISSSDHAIDWSRKRRFPKELTTLLELLSGPFSDILRKLLPFYKMQGREKTIVNFFTICLGSCVDPTWSDQEPSQDFKDQIGFTYLHRKVTNVGDGRFDLESILVKEGMARDIFGWTPFHYAAARADLRFPDINEDSACVETLLEVARFGTEIEVDVWKQSPIHTALVNHSYDCPKEKKLLGAEILLTHWDKFKAQHGDKQSVLHLAISFLDFGELFDLIKMLEAHDKKQPNVDLVNRYRDTPLHLAVRDKRPDLVRCLVRFGASPSFKNDSQISPMMLACDSGDLSLVRYVSQARKYEGSETDGQGRTALHHAILNKKWSVDDCAQVAKILAGVMANVDALDQEHCSPLHYAADTCNSVAFSILRESKANIELTDKSGRNMLHHAVVSDDRSPGCSRKDLIDLICEDISPAAIDARDTNGDTPLHLAVNFDNDDTVLLILSKNANLQIGDCSGMTPFMKACGSNRCLEFIKYTVEQSNILESNADKSQPVTKDGSNNNSYRDGTEVKFAKSCVNPHFKDFDVNKVDSRYGESALAWACETGSVEAVEILLLAKAVSFSIQATKFHGYTPLHLALHRDNHDIVQRLVADPRVVSSLGIADDNGLTPIDFAIRKSNESCLLQLLKHNNVGLQRFSSSQLEEIMDKYRENESWAMAWHEWLMRVKAGEHISFPVHSLAKIGRRKEVEELLQFHMDASELDEDKWTPADVAQWYDHVDLMHYLRDKEFKGDFIRHAYRWPSTFFDLYENSTLETMTCPNTNPSLKLKLDVKIPETNSVDDQSCYIRTKEAIPPTTKDFYFQVELVHFPESKVIAIGFCQSKVEKNRVPGWDKGTWAYHSDDGGLFIETDWSTVNHDEAICKQGDVMGVGLSMETGGFYCTRNGKEIEPRNAFDGQNFRIGKLYPCIGIRNARSGDKFRVLVTLPGYQDA